MKAAEAPAKREPSSPQTPVVLSYFQLRKAVGIIGFALPAVLALGNALILGHLKIECTISDYVHTAVGSIFIGSLGAIGVFLISCRGYDRKDEIAGSLAGAFAVGVAVFRTTPCDGHIDLVGGLHFASATLLFLTLAYFCLKLFTKTDRATPTREKLKRNAVYRFCGWTILGCIALIAVALVRLPRELLDKLSLIFWLETVAVMVFGFAWLVKGETFLKDRVV